MGPFPSLDRYKKRDTKLTVERSSLVYSIFPPFRDGGPIDYPEVLVRYQAHKIRSVVVVHSTFQLSTFQFKTSLLPYVALPRRYTPSASAPLMRRLYHRSLDHESGKGREVTKREARRADKRDGVAS